MEKVVLDDDNIILYNGDCSQILPTLGRNAAEICVTSPPYNLHTKHHNSQTSTSKKFQEKLERWYADDMPEWEYQGWQQGVIHELMKTCRSSIFYNHKIRYAWHSRNVYKNENKIYHPMHWLHKFPIWCEIIWDRCGIGHPTSRYHNQTEKIFQIGKPRKWKNEQGLTNIWRIPPSRNQGHVCTFPEKLVENCMMTTTDEGDTIIDPFMGAGTTGIVAVKYGRKFIGIEKDPEFFQLAVKNIKKHLTLYNNQERINQKV